MNTIDIQEVINKLVESVRQFAHTLCDVLNETMHALLDAMAELNLQENFNTWFEATNVLEQATTKEKHYILHAKKVRTRKKYFNRVKRRIRKGR